MLKKRNVMTIGTLAKTAGVGVETVRYYQRRGLMSEPEKPYGGSDITTNKRLLGFILFARLNGLDLVWMKLVSY